MPGYVMHLAVATKALEKLHITNPEYVSEFMLGTIIADAVTTKDKKVTHFWTDEQYERFVRRPSEDIFISQVGSDISKPFYKGYLCHLMYDALYLDRYWMEHFCFYDADGNEASLYNEVSKVKVFGHDIMYDRSIFFSDEYFYGDYDRINRYIISRYHIPKLDISRSSIPETLFGVPKAAYEDKLLDMIEFINSETEAVSDKKIEKPNLRALDLNDFTSLIDDMIKVCVDTI